MGNDVSADKAAFKAESSPSLRFGACGNTGGIRAGIGIRGNICRAFAIDDQHIAVINGSCRKQSKKSGGMDGSFGVGRRELSVRAAAGNRAVAILCDLIHAAENPGVQRRVLVFRRIR